MFQGVDKFVADYDNKIANDHARAQARQNATKAIAESAAAQVAKPVNEPPQPQSIKELLPPPTLQLAVTQAPLPIPTDGFFFTPGTNPNPSPNPNPPNPTPNLKSVMYPVPNPGHKSVMVPVTAQHANPKSVLNNPNPTGNQASVYKQ